MLTFEHDRSLGMGCLGIGGFCRVKSDLWRSEKNTFKTVGHESNPISRLVLVGGYHLYVFDTLCQ